MTDYSRTAVTAAVEKGFRDLLWRNECPIDCGWHGSEWTSRDDAVRFLDGEKGQHQCLRTPAAMTEAVADLDEIAGLVRLARDANEARAAEIGKLAAVGEPAGDAQREVDDRRMLVAGWFLRRTEILKGLMLPSGPREGEQASG